jgi:hypothetical protein
MNIVSLNASYHAVYTSSVVALRKMFYLIDYECRETGIVNASKLGRPLKLFSLKIKKINSCVSLSIYPCMTTDDCRNLLTDKDAVCLFLSNFYTCIDQNNTNEFRLRPEDYAIV